MKSGKHFQRLTAAIFMAVLCLAFAFSPLRVSAEEASQGREAPEIEGLVYDHSMELTYAEAFDVHYYEGGYKLLVCYDSASYLLVPEGAEVPAGLPEDIIVIQQPLHIYGQ